jgi:hypothetical protein
MAALRPTRRDMLALAALTAAGWPNAIPACPAAGGREASPAGDLVAALFSDLESAMAVGAGCLRSLPGAPPTPAAMLEAIGAYHSPARLRAQIRRDFATGDMVEVGGWLLSATEARLYALAALALPQSA